MVCICHHCHPESMLGRNFVYLLPKKITGNQKAIFSKWTTSKEQAHKTA